MMKNLIIFIFLIIPYIVHSQFGTPDLAFGINGKVDHDYGVSFLTPTLAVEQLDGKIVVSTNNNIVTNGILLTRYLENGTIDSTYGTNGLATDVNITSGMQKIALQTDGKLLLQNSNMIARFNENGTVDNNFGINGKVESLMISGQLQTQYLFQDFALQSDGKIILFNRGFVGNQSYLTRLNTNGTIDTSYGTNGFFKPLINNNLTIFNIEVQQDGKFLFIATYDFNSYIMVRYNQNNTLDTSYGVNGYFVLNNNNPDAFRLLLPSDDKSALLTLGGPLAFNMSRYNTNGTLDTSFNYNGIFSNGTFKVHDFKIQPDNKIVFFGESLINFIDYNTMFRINSNGSVDNSFGTNGFVHNTYSNLHNNPGYLCNLILNSGKIMCFGSYSDGLNNPDGSPHVLTVLERFNSGLGLSNQEFETSNQIIVSPNPSNNIFKIDLKANFQTIAIFDLLGKSIYNQNIDSQLQVKIDLTGFASGYYVAKLVGENGTSIVKLLKE